MKTLQRFDLSAYLFIEDILRAIDNEQPKPALPQLTHVTAYIGDETSRSEEQRRLLSVCQARKITIEQATFMNVTSRTRWETVKRFRAIT